MTLTLQDRARGVMVGLACGDALGAQVEFMARGSFPHQSEMTGGGPHRLQPGQWTDDTAMALHLGRHLLVDAHVANPGGLAGRWIGWWRQGDGSCTGKCFDIGTQTRAALDSWRSSGWYEAPDTARGNGALMRCAPAALRHHDHLTHAYSAAWQQALLTHPRESADLCGVFAALLAEVITRGDEPDRTRERLATEYGHVYRRQVAQVDSSGFDKSTFEAALWCVMHASDPRAAIVTAANLGDDADTVGAVTGALAGAVWGAQALRTLSPGWFRVLARQKPILEVADALVAA